MRLISISTLLVAASVALPSYASTGYVVTESVSDYTACGAGPVQFANANADGFFSAVTNGGFFNPNGGLFKKLYQRHDGDVWDSDFYDWDVTQSTPDFDGLNFDASDDFVTIAYYAGHGINSNVTVPTIACHHDSDCNPVPAGRIGPGLCQTYPGSRNENGSKGTIEGNCRWGFNNALYTCGSNDSHGHLVSYGTTGSGVAWGESSSQLNPGWGGAGTNGGANLVVLNSSYGTTAGFVAQSLIPPSVGIHMLAANMVVNGDTTVTAELGPDFGGFAVSNETGSVGAAWTDGAMGLMPGGVDTGDCLGRKGYTLCGCNVVLAVDTQESIAQWHVNVENWEDLLQDVHDSGGNAFYAWRASCNYDVIDYKFDIDN